MHKITSPAIKNESIFKTGLVDAEPPFLGDEKVDTSTDGIFFLRLDMMES